MSPAANAWGLQKDAYQVQTQVIAGSQSVLVDSALVIAEPIRDEFTVTVHTVVQWPISSSTPVTSAFGYRTVPWRSFHQGTDLGASSGTDIHAIADAVVVQAGWAGSCGEEVTLLSTIDGVQVLSNYCHMISGSIRVTESQKIPRGTILGNVGRTGDATGPHLHFGIMINGTFIDSYSWLIQHSNVQYYEGG